MSWMAEPERPVTPPETKRFFCPFCGAEEPETIVLGVCHEVLGCDRCLSLQDAGEYFREKEAMRDA